MMLVALATLATSIGSPPARAAAADSIRSPRFGGVRIYRPAGPVSRVVLFASGDGGWMLGVVGMAQALAQDGSLVAGIDIRQYRARARLGSGCLYAAADFEALSQQVQQVVGLPSYLPPIVAGYSSGATLAYAVLAQAPSGTFSGAVSFGFDPDLQGFPALCRGAGSGLHGVPGKVWTTRLDAVPSLPAPWTILQGQADQVFSHDAARDFAARVEGATFVSLPGVGHGFGVTGRWRPALLSAVRGMHGDQAEIVPSDSGGTLRLPVVEVETRHPSSPTLVVFLSGDGGWASLDREIARVLADSGVRVVGLNSLQYFWRARTPDGASADLARLIRRYLARWNLTSVVLAGYSQGANVLPAMTARLPADLKHRIARLVLLGPGREADFEFHFASWLGRQSTGSLPILPDIARVDGLPILCIYGSEEHNSLCPLLSSPPAERVEVNGGHHFDGDYPGLAHRMLRGLSLTSPAGRSSPSGRPPGGSR